jgi:hypothetical protein
MQWLGFECCNEQQQPGEGRGKTVKKDSLSLWSMVKGDDQERVVVAAAL